MTKDISDRIKSLETLEKITTQELDQLRYRLVDMQSRCDDLIYQKDQLENHEFEERTKASNDPQWAQTFDAFCDNNQRIIKGLSSQIRNLQEHMESLREQIQNQYQENKKLESAREGKQADLKGLEKQKEQRTLDHLAEIRHRQKQRRQF